MIICVVTVCYCEMFWAHLPHRLSSLTNDRHVWFFGLGLCVDWDASYSSQVFNYLFQSQLWSIGISRIVTSGGSEFHNISWRHTATTPGTGLLLARRRSVAGPKVGDYSWHGTTPGPWHRYTDTHTDTVTVTDLSDCDLRPVSLSVPVVWHLTFTDSGSMFFTISTISWYSYTHGFNKIYTCGGVRIDFGASNQGRFLDERTFTLPIICHHYYICLHSTCGLNEFRFRLEGSVYLLKFFYALRALPVLSRLLYSHILLILSLSSPPSSLSATTINTQLQAA